jgi:TolB-like protein/cytochrome c-type biogenesis protein CcmH/NrfG
VTEGSSFLAELKRRNVLRAAALYAAAVWALAQGLAQLLPLFGSYDWIARWFVIAGVIGFPFWLAFAWLYEFTPQGLKRESEVAPGDSIAHSTGRKLDFWIIGIMAVAIVLLLANTFASHTDVGSRQSATNTTSPAPAFHPPTDTLMVLPFTNLGGDASQQYFSDGITEELTNALGQNPGLRVIAWDTASKYRDGTQAATAIGKALNVANLLHGSIRRQGDAVRVTAELVDTTTGYQLWSHHYDDSLKNIFAVQDRISQAIADALKIKFAGARVSRTIDSEAHDLVLKARALMQTSGIAGPAYEQARKNFERAIALDPDYADAHAGLARTWFELSQFSNMPLQDLLPHVRTEASKALALDPRNVGALVQLANADAVEGRNVEALANYKRALEIDPSNAVAHLDYAIMLPLKQGLAETLEAVRLDPENAIAQTNLASYYMDLGDFQRALAPVKVTMRLAPHAPSAVFNLAQIYALLQRDEDAAKAFDLAQPTTPFDRQLIAAGRLAYQSALDPKLRPQALAALKPLRERNDLDSYTRANLVELYLELGEQSAAMELLPGICRDAPVTCSDIQVNPSYKALHDEPGFTKLVQQYDTSH